MEVLLPNITYKTTPERALAPRPPALNGLRIGFLDAWGHQADDGRVEMYPLLTAYRKLIGERCQPSETTWLLKPHVSVPLSQEVLDELAANTDVVLNGEAA